MASEATCCWFWGRLIRKVSVTSSVRYRLGYVWALFRRGHLFCWSELFSRWLVLLATVFFPALGASVSQHLAEFYDVQARREER